MRPNSSNELFVAFLLRPLFRLAEDVVNRETI